MNKVIHYVKCRNCSYEWIPRSTRLVECPNCKVRNPLGKNPPNIIVPEQSYSKDIKINEEVKDNSTLNKERYRA